jgi:hypothetical protein
LLYSLFKSCLDVKLNEPAVRCWRLGFFFPSAQQVMPRNSCWSVDRASIENAEKPRFPGFFTILRAFPRMTLRESQRKNADLQRFSHRPSSITREKRRKQGN